MNVWVFLRDDEQEITRILNEYGGKDIRVQDAPEPWLEPAHQTFAPDPK